MRDETATIYPKAVVKPKTSEMIGKNCSIGDFAFVVPRVLEMEEGSQIGPHAIVSGGGEVYLKKYCVVGFGATLIPATDTKEAKYMCEAGPEEDRDIIRGSITIGENAYIGSRSVICVSRRCPDIVIGKGAVIGSLSYIDRSVPENTIIRPDIKYIVKKRF